MAERVLLVDDDADILITLSAMLTSAGYEVESALGAREALAISAGRRYDLAVMDLMMEESDSGVQVARELRRRPETAGTPIILLTAVAEKTGFRVPLATEEEREWLQVDAWLDKPVTAERLLAEIAR